MRSRHLFFALHVLSMLGCAPEAPSALPPPPPPSRIDAADAEAFLRDDLASLRKAGVLRALVHQAAADDIPRANNTHARDRASLEALAASLGVALQYVVVADRRELLPSLMQGKGELLAEPRLVVRDPQLGFASPLHVIDLVVVARAGAKDAPKKATELAGKSVVAHPAVATDATLSKVSGLAIVEAAPALDEQDLLAEVGSGAVALTVVRSDSLTSYATYADDVQRLFALAEKRPVAWVTRAGSTALREAAAAVVYEREMTQHKKQGLGGDLDAIQKRKVLRVAMLNNAASYFVYRGQEVGFQYDLAALIANRLGVRLEVTVPDKPADMADLIAADKVDLVPVSLGEGSAADLLDFTIPIATAAWVLVQPAGEAPIQNEADLAGRKVHVRASSAYHAALTKIATRVPGLQIVAAPEDMETEDLIDAVGKGELPLTVSNSILLDVERTHRSDVQGTLVISPKQPLVYGLRKGTPQLKERLDKLLERELTGASYRAIYAKYFRDKERMAELRAAESSTSGQISPYDELARRWGGTYNVDWRLVLAQMYQESRFDPQAKSWVGAAGLMQIMPRTARELGLKDAYEPEGNVRAGVQYLARLIGRYEPRLPMRQRVRFALASYNAGYDHVADARTLAKKQGLDPDRWFDNVEKAILLLEKPKYYRRARRGFCRGREPVAYVSRIQSKYDAYVALMPGGGLMDE